MISGVSVAVLTVRYRSKCIWQKSLAILHDSKDRQRIMALGWQYFK